MCPGRVSTNIGKLWANIRELEMEIGKEMDELERLLEL